MRRPPHERGVALLTVLLMVAVMSAIAVGVLDDIRFGIRRTANARIGAQAQYYALGAEALARARIARLLERDTGRTTLAGDWNGRPLSFPVEGGAITASVSDATLCFNLNSVVTTGGGEPFSRREEGVRQFAALMAALGIDGSTQLADTLAEWIDSNDVGAAEDSAYLEGPRPHRTAAYPLAEVSELRAVRGFNGAIYARLRPWVCALPTTDLSPININTLSSERAVLITTVTQGKVDPAAAAAVLNQRPASGWNDLSQVWSLPAFANAPADPGTRNQLQLRTRYFALDAQVSFAGTETRLSALFDAPGPGAVRLAARRWTRDE